MIIFGGFVLTGLLGLVAFFLRRLLSDHDDTKKKLSALDSRVSELKLSVEQNFVSFDTFETMRVEFRRNFEQLFQSSSKQNEILARLDERSKWEERFATIMERIAPRRK